LTIPKQVVERQENGLLQAWEIVEQVRLDANLVVLSACETALGKEVAGEGILGLTRAFQYAGARSVLASLWSMADVSTGELMQRFCADLTQGMAKDEALRQAQLAVINGPVVIGEGEDAIERGLSTPFYWAAFQIYGDWKLRLQREPISRSARATVVDDRLCPWSSVPFAERSSLLWPCRAVAHAR